MKITNGAVKLEASYGGFESGYGADWGSRLRLLAIPECYQTRPEDAACRPVPVQSDNKREEQDGVRAGDAAGAGFALS
ncbi:hypothetical protein AB0H83_13240 [Dactylosporangium sp. NPDC050688]|uniref:hypothetical protein n=1 Tax=Dactylosporangium sp. NPDC050688 TaxID=3157217 RepID=UPI00340BF921